MEAVFRFGTYLPNQGNEWVYHLQLGWLFVQPDWRGGFWLWMPGKSGRTKESVWYLPVVDGSAGWLYPIYSSGNRYFTIISGREFGNG